MSSKVIATPNPALNLRPNPNQFSKKPDISSISFSSHVSKSKFSIRNPSRARPAARIEALYAPPAERRETLYQVLGIGESESSFSDIKKAYKQMARKYHPDVSPPERVDEYTRRFIMVHEAYETLSNPHTKASYDRDLASGFRFQFSTTKSHRYNEEMKEKEEWRSTWESQLDELKRRDSTKETSWAAKMRSSRI